jgi:hypothetical protein
MVQRDRQKDLEELATAFYENLTMVNIEYGGIGLDPKRPFGNGFVEADILGIIGWDEEGDDGYDVCYTREQRDYARSLYHDHLIPYLREKHLSD